MHLSFALLQTYVITPRGVITIRYLTVLYDDHICVFTFKFQSNQ